MFSVFVQVLVSPQQIVQVAPGVSGGTWCIPPWHRAPRGTLINNNNRNYKTPVIKANVPTFITQGHL